MGSLSLRSRIFGLLLLSSIVSYCGPARAQGYNSVVITEIMADPTPVVGLPDAEYLELHNRTQQAVSLKGWRLEMGERVAVLPDSVLVPGGFLILCSRTSVGVLSAFGRVVGLTPFTLVNAGATLALRNSKGTLVHSVAYKDTWWPSDKREGGYALEMIDPANPCGETNNWKVSMAAAGGTPGKVNSVAGPNPDRKAPVAQRVELSGASQVDIYFNERLDSLASVQSGVFAIRGRTIRNVSLQSPSYQVVSLLLDSPLLAGQRYELLLKNVADCAGNLLAQATFSLGLPVKAALGDVVLNEILYDPRVGGVEFVELYNRTQNYINLKDWAVGVVRNGQPTSFRSLTTNNLLLEPLGFMAFSINSDTLASQYPTERSRNLVEVPSLPTFTNGSGGVALRTSEGTLFDMFEYQDGFHSPFLSSSKGVALERKYPEKAGNDPQNWHSAASLVGYATPGYANSQGLNGPPADEFRVEPEVFTPNGDGVDEYVTIDYIASVAGKIGSVRIFDVQGRLVRNLLQNQLIGTDGEVRWEGNDTRGMLSRTGYYLILIDTLDTQGNAQQFRKRVVLLMP